MTLTPDMYWADKLLKSEATHELVRLELMRSHEQCEDDWKLRDALRQVVKYYSNASQYKEFMRRNDDESSI